MKIVKGNFDDGKPRNSIVARDSKLQTSIFMDLIKPHLGKQHYLDDIETLLQLAIVAWNMAGIEALKFPAFKQIFSLTIKNAGIGKKDLDIIKLMMENKHKKYDKYTFFVLDYIFDLGVPAEKRITVKTSTFEEFMNLDDEEDEFDDEFDDELDDELEDEDYVENDEGIVTRVSLLITPKADFISFLRSMEVPAAKELKRIVSNVYLIPEMENDKQTMLWVKNNYARIFSYELMDWIPDEECWPKKRNYTMFNEFFEVAFQPLITDMVKEPLRKY
jgi:hypothetical protein